MNIHTNRKLTIDDSQLSSGVFQAHTVQSNKRYKLRVAFGNKLLNYDLNNRGEWETFSLQYGSGAYKILLYEQVSGNRYTQVGMIKLNVIITNAAIPFLSKNQYINYSVDLHSIVTMLMPQNNDEREFLDNLKFYITSKFKYDFLKAATIKSGMLPDIDGCFNSKTGICYDIAALCVAILREANIPSKLVIGYADNAYHAWVIAEINNGQLFFDPTVELKAMKRPKKYTVERFY